MSRSSCFETGRQLLPSHQLCAHITLLAPHLQKQQESNAAHQKGEPHSQAHKKLRARNMGGFLLQELLYKTILARADKGLLHHSPFLKRPEQFKDHSTFLRNIPHSAGYTGINAPSTHLSNIPAGSQQEHCQHPKKMLFPV